MKIDWKTVSKSEGYISLKKAMTKDIQKNWRTKKEIYARFNWVICRAKHYAHVKEIPLEEVLNAWEAERDYWWINFYGEGRQPKLRKALNVKPRGLRATLKYCRLHYKYNPRLRSQRILELLQLEQKKLSIKSPKRWSNEAKVRAKKRKICK